MNINFLPLFRFAEAMCHGRIVRFGNGVLSNYIAEGMVDADTIAKFGGIAEIIEPTPAGNANLPIGNKD